MRTTRAAIPHRGTLPGAEAATGTIPVLQSAGLPPR
jgi:hypothetical protein